MKLKNISVAIMVALGAAACGGSDSHDSNKPADPPAQPPAPTPDNKPQQPEAKTDDKLVDPTGTKVVDGRDLSKESTVGGLQYIRRDDSDYDRVFNPDKMASATPLLGVGLDTQNPKLTNIVLARRDLDRENDKAVRAQFAGAIENEPLTSDGKPRDVPSLQVENFKHVDILAGAYKQVGSADFGDVNNRLGADHNIDTHIQDNLNNKGRATRERVSHVYTLRYEYRQPHVDFPNVDPAHYNYISQLTDTDPLNPEYKVDPAEKRLSFLTIPDKPKKPSQDDLIQAGNLGIDWAGQDIQIDPITEKIIEASDSDEIKARAITKKRNQSWHKVNNGLGDGPKSGGYIVNNEQKYGSLDQANGDGNRNNPNDHSAYAYAWRNKPTDPNSPPAVDWTTTHYPRNFWGRGAYPRYPMQNLEYPNYKGDAQPRYPNVPYNEAHRKNDSHTTNDAAFTHEHAYLDQDEFTAIRIGQPVRPLKNPKPNTWEWTLEQKWSYKKYEQIGTDPTTHQPIYGFVTYSIANGNYATEYDKDGHCGHTNTVDCTKEWTLEWVDWNTPTNKGDGEIGAFRGPHYYGWQEYALTLRYNDERIWKPDAPGYKSEYEKKYGANLIWWSTQDSAFENWATMEGWNPRARRVDNNVPSKGGEGSEDLVWAEGHNNGKYARDRDLEIQPTGDITNGLIRIGNGRPTLGQELQWDKESSQWKDHHKTTTRIFGHYHLAWRDGEAKESKPMSMNSYLGARSFVAQVKGRLQTPTHQGFYSDLDSPADYYSIGAQPMTLKKVQYGRVTTQLDLANGEGPFGDGFLRAPFAKKGDKDSVDNYFFRGIDATSVEDMPKEGSAKYQGHALMYGINNDFHGMTGKLDHTQNLPNAFAGVIRGNAQMGLGNFVEADVDFATRKVKGDVYNAWLVSDKSPSVVHDKLVSFTGDITGNTVLGTADRTYIPGNDKADFRAAFFGKEADEMGGSFNSVKPDDKYGSAYEYGDWGGVFGAKKMGSGNTFQGDDGANVYGN